MISIVILFKCNRKLKWGPKPMLNRISNSRINANIN